MTSHVCLIVCNRADDVGNGYNKIIREKKDVFARYGLTLMVREQIVTQLDAVYYSLCVVYPPMREKASFFPELYRKFSDVGSSSTRY